MTATSFILSICTKMKIRLFLFTVVTGMWVALYHLVLSPTSVLLRQSAAVATVKNSDAAYIAQQAVESTSSRTLFSLGLILIAALFFVQPIINLFKHNES